MGKAKYMYIEKLHPYGRKPVRMTPGSAGYDLFSVSDVVVHAWRTANVPLGIAMKFPPNSYGRIASRSGLSKNHNIIAEGTIDGDYRGEVMVILRNLGDKDYTVETGERIAQIIIEPKLDPEVVEVSALDLTERGTSGFGSTGKHGDSKSLASTSVESDVRNLLAKMNEGVLTHAIQ